MNWDDLLDECAARFGTAPRTFSFLERRVYLRYPRPAWLKADPTDGIGIIFDRAEAILRDGSLRWGFIVQANELLFEPGRIDCPATIAFGTDDGDPMLPLELEPIVGAVAALKETRPEDPALAPVARHLTEELRREYGLPLPASLTDGRRVAMSTTMILRKHLPLGRLCAPVVPLLADPEHDGVVIPLPERWWPERLAAWWSAGA